jgi:hypothetical protein
LSVQMLCRIFLPLAVIEIALALNSHFTYELSDNFVALDRRKRDAPWEPLPTDVTEEQEDSEHTYYNMSVYTNTSDFDKYYVDMSDWLKREGVVGQAEHEHLNNSYRKAAAVNITFKFPFYGHLLSNLTIATGGFCYVGDQTHSWLAATQYIAPLMANFDTMSNDSSISFGGNNERMVIEWTNVRLRDDKDVEPFTFQTSLFKNGNIWFAYKQVPISVSNISDMNHPCKIGISDAYMFFHKFPGSSKASPGKRVIHEYHRISVLPEKVASKTVVVLTALPTCLGFSTCNACANSNLKNFNCSWCYTKDAPEKSFCSDQAGLHRRRQEWVEGSCTLEYNKNTYCADEPASRDNGTDTSAASSPVPNHVDPSMDNKSVDKEHTESSGGGGVAFFVVLVTVAIGVSLWGLYAFYNPHTTSGQLLIKYRPSQWQIPSSHVRYSANVHM